jgi:selenocysteine lyase/cysteine desulfurase
VARDRYEVVPGARRFENWEFNYAAVIGLGVAVEYALSWGMPTIEARITDLGDTLRQRLAAVPGVTVHDIGRRRCGIVSFSSEGIAAETIVESLARQGITVGTSTVFSTRIDAERRGLPTVVRASVHYYTTEAEIETLARAVEALSA